MKIKAISCVLAMIVVLSALNVGSVVCSAKTAQVTSTSNSVSGPFGKYAKTVTVTIGRNDVAGSNLPSGDSLSNNLFLKAIKNDLNIDVKYSWIGSGTDQTQYDDKVNLAIASGDIPDVMYVDNLNQLNQMVKAGMLEDIKSAYTKTASPLITARYNSLPSDIRFSTSIFNGKMYALPNVNINYQYTELWVRKDWMTKVGAKTPKTLTDVINLAKTFMQKDPGGNGSGKTVGIAVNLTNGAVAGNYNGENVLDSIFNSFGSYPQSWIKQSSGKYIYGSVAPATKTALAAIAQMYKAGVIDPEFAVHSSTDENALLISGKCGITFGPWWEPYWPLNSAQSNNPSSDWEPILAPLSSNGIYNAPIPDPHTEWMVVKKGMKNPEAVIEILNLEYQGIKQIDPKVKNVNPNIINIYPNSMGVMWTVWPFPIQVEFWNENLMNYSDLSKAWNAKSTAGLTYQETETYNDFVKQNADPGMDNAAWQDWAARYEGQGLMVNNQKIVKFPTIGFPAQTATQVSKWTNLQSLEQQTFLQIIMGQKPTSYFDTFVKQWGQEGGTQITSEVNTQLK